MMGPVNNKQLDQ